MTLFRLLPALMILTLFAATVSALEPAPRLSDREIIEALTDLKAGQKALLREIDQRFEAVDRRFEIMDKRFEELRSDMNQRFETIDKRLEEQSNLMVGMMQTFGGIVLVMISFAIWDRRTMIRPFETKVRHLEKQLEPIEPLVRETSQDRQRLQALLEAVRALAKNHPEASAILKTASLL